jgi:4-hydroxy-tetrahydrodipicolinate reductase
MIRVCVAGATGWAGRAVADAVHEADDLALVGVIARSTAGRDFGTAVGGEAIGVPVVAGVGDLAPGSVDVLVDYTSHLAVRANALAAIERGMAVVVGSSGLTAADFAEIDELARRRKVGVIAAGNFSITAAMAQAAALLVAPHLTHAEVIDFAAAEKRDAPSGTARELAERLSDAIGASAPDVDPEARPARGAPTGAIHVHSVRLPSFTVSTEVVFGLPDERLTIRHDAGSSSAPYVAGTLLAIRRVRGRVGLTRGLDTLLLE